MRHCLLINTDPALHCIAPTLTPPRRPSPRNPGPCRQFIGLSLRTRTRLPHITLVVARGRTVDIWSGPGTREHQHFNTATLHTFIVSEDVDVSDMSGWAADARAGQDNP